MRTVPGPGQPLTLLIEALATGVMQYAPPMTAVCTPGRPVREIGSRKHCRGELLQTCPDTQSGQLGGLQSLSLVHERNGSLLQS